jgi:signal transduction histidine kinase
VTTYSSRAARAPHRRWVPRVGDGPPRERRPPHRGPRPTLRLRLTLLNGLLLVGTGLLLILLGWLLVGPTVRVLDHVPPGTLITLEDPNGQRRSVDFAQYQADRASDLEQELLLKGLIALALVGGAGVVGAYLVSGRALRSLHQVTTTAQRLSTDTLDQRIDHAGPDDEVKELADTFDAMLDRLSGAFGSQQRFVANASHELRTPLAVMRTEIDVTLADPDASVEELRRMGTVVRAASDRANDLIEALLLLARTEAQAGRLEKQVLVDLAVGVRTTLAAISRETGRLQLTVETDFRPALVLGDPNLLERLAGNLVENAVRHNVDGGWVRVGTVTAGGRARLVVASSGPVVENAVRYNTRGGLVSVRTSTEDDRVYLVVANTGPQVSRAEVPGLFEPFRRGGRERTGTRGAGLGLSIVGAVVTAHGGTVSAAPLPGGGLEVTVVLPAARVASPDGVSVRS